MLLPNVGTEAHPVASVSKAFTETESRWSTIQQETYGEYFSISLLSPILCGHTYIVQEAYGVYFSILRLSHILLGHTIIVETDHKNLLFLEKASSPKLTRWRLRLQEYAFSVFHIPGKNNYVADALSRCHRLAVESAGDDLRGEEAEFAQHKGSSVAERYHNSVEIGRAHV